MKIVLVLVSLVGTIEVSICGGKEPDYLSSFIYGHTPSNFGIICDNLNLATRCQPGSTSTYIYILRYREN